MTAILMKWKLRQHCVCSHPNIESQTKFQSYPSFRQNRSKSPSVEPSSITIIITSSYSGHKETFITLFISFENTFSKRKQLMQKIYLTPGCTKNKGPLEKGYVGNTFYKHTFSTWIIQYGGSKEILERGFDIELKIRLLMWLNL